MIMHTTVLVLGLILLYSGLGNGLVTDFRCTNGSVCAGDTVECTCTTSTGILSWLITSNEEGAVYNQTEEHDIEVTFVRIHANDTVQMYGHNFTFNDNLNTSRLIFKLNQSESVLIVCANGHDGDNASTTVTDSGYNVTPPINLTTTFNSSGVTLKWYDPGNNCTSTEYQVILNNSILDNALIYTTRNTNWFISSTDLSLTANYTYTVKGWNGQESNASDPFTLAPAEVNVTITATNATDLCNNNSCCANVTVSIQLVSSASGLQHANQNYNISYSSTEQMSIDMKEGALRVYKLPHNTTYCFNVTTINYFDTGMTTNNCVKIPNYQCQSSETEPTPNTPPPTITPPPTTTPLTTTPQPTTTPPTTTTPPPSGLSVVAIAGIIDGIVFLILTCIIIVLLIIISKNRNKAGNTNRVTPKN